MLPKAGESPVIAFDPDPIIFEAMTGIGISRSGKAVPLDDLLKQAETGLGPLDRTVNEGMVKDHYKEAFYSEKEIPRHVGAGELAWGKKPVLFFRHPEPERWNVFLEDWARTFYRMGWKIVLIEKPGQNDVSRTLKALGFHDTLSQKVSSNILSQLNELGIYYATLRPGWTVGGSVHVFEMKQTERKASKEGVVDETVSTLSHSDYKGYYATMGIDFNATSEEIKRVHRDWVRKLHPDRNKEPGAEEKLKRVNAANSVLSDKEKRTQYDEVCRVVLLSALVAVSIGILYLLHSSASWQHGMMRTALMITACAIPAIRREEPDKALKKWRHQENLNSRRLEKRAA